MMKYLLCWQMVMLHRSSLVKMEQNSFHSQYCAHQIIEATKIIDIHYSCHMTKSFTVKRQSIFQKYHFSNRMSWMSKKLKLRQNKFRFDCGGVKFHKITEKNRALNNFFFPSIYSSLRTYKISGSSANRPWHEVNIVFQGLIYNCSSRAHSKK